jgi:nucleotide-binding universal stress UspA family protein
MFRTIYLPLDNSDYSNASIDIALELARAFGSQLIGSHVYAARMHDYRFKQMEYTLPEEYQDEQELERQRKIHDSLITRGLRLISDSYLDVLLERSALAQIPCEPKTFDGQNWQELVKDIENSPYDLVIMGALGMGAVKESQIGSVCERVTRRVRKDVLVVKDARPWQEQHEGSIAVAIDGSPQSFGGLKLAIELGRALQRPVEAIAVYDPYLHYSVFNSIVHVLSQEAAKVFRFKEQEQLHEEIIDTGLAKIYESHLQIAKNVAAEDGVDLKVTLMDGKAWEKILLWTKRERPWLLVMGRIGVHSDQEMDIGSNSQNLLRQVPCNVLLCSSTYVPQIDIRAEATITWTPEASARMERVPAFVRGVARTAIHRYAMERGHSVISNSIVDDAVSEILPESAARAMGIAAKTIAIEAHATSPNQDATSICGECGYAARNVLPVACPVCHSGPERFTLIDKRLVESAAAQEGPISEEETFDGVKIKWTEEAKQLLWTMTDAYARRRAKARIEKMARVQRLPAITADFANPIVQETIGDLSSLHTNIPLPSSSMEPTLTSPTEATQGQTEHAKDALSSSNQETEPAPEDQPIWTPEARKRLERVPEGYMREMTEDIILKHAVDTQTASITLTLAEEGIEIAKGEMVAMIQAQQTRKPKREQRPSNGQCPVTHEGASDTHAMEQPPLDACPLPRVTENAQKYIEALADRSEASNKTSAERASKLVEHVAAQRASERGLNEITPEFIAQLGKKLGYGHPASEKTYEHDFVWTAEALAKLEEVPDFCRELTRWRVEWTAYKKNLGRLITPEAMEVKYGLWGEVSRHIRERSDRQLPWTQEAEQRLEKVPEFVKGQVIQSVEGNARQMGYAQVTSDVLNHVIEKWRATGDFHEGRYGFK